MRKCVGESMENTRPKRLVKPSKTLFIVENKAWKMNGAAVASNAIEIRNKHTLALKTFQTVYEDKISAPIAGEISRENRKDRNRNLNSRNRNELRLTFQLAKLSFACIFIGR